MEVKSVFMDLTEGKKKGNVWKLESEAFKEPIEIKIGYDNKELAQFNGEIEGIKSELRNQKSELDALKLNDKVLDDAVDTLIQRLDGVNRTFVEQNKRIENQNEEIKSLYKVIADLKTTVETLSGTILHLQEQTSLIQKKITKQPMVFSDTTFISGHERVGLGILEVPSGEYLVIEKYLLLEPNEFVENHDGIKINKITVTDNQYIPMYNLFGGTALDTPTAKVYWTLAFIPC